MQFIVIAHDYKRAGLKRRLKVRGDHVAMGDKMVKEGSALYGVALLDKKGKMKGSVMVLDFPTRKAFDAWLKTEPYVTGNVWESIEVIPCKVGPSFTK